MGNDRGANWVHIVVAVITVAGGIAVALITRDAYTNREVAGPTSEVSGVVEAAPPAVPSSPVAITGILIGKTGLEPFVSEVITQFAPQDEIAITVRYTAAEQVANFPVRLSAQIFSGIGTGVEEQVSDISRPGDSFWTFRFKPEEGWISSQQFVSIEIDGQKAYRQVLTINHE